MKKSLLVLIPTIFLATACSPTNKNCNHVDEDPKDHKCDLCGKKVSEHIDENGDYFCDICSAMIGSPEDVETCADDDETCREQQGSDKVKPDPSYPFYLRVYKDPTMNQVKTIEANTDTSTKIDEQKRFTFHNQSEEYLDLVQDPNKFDVATITGKKATGINKFATIHAINNYSPNLTSDFSVNVIDFDNDTMKLWEYTSADRKQFGYDSKTEKQGVKEGTARLGDLDWEFNRSTVNSMNTGNGGIYFGKNEFPENVTLVNRNVRPIKAITIEHGSARSLAKLSVKIGDQLIKTVKSPKPSYSKLTKTRFDCSNLVGDITLEAITPEFEVEKIEDPDYMRPGAFYLKSIWIEYGEEVVTGIKVADSSSQQTIFPSWDAFNTEGLVVNRITENGESEIDPTSLEIIAPDFETNPDASKEVTIKYKDFETKYTIYKADKIELDPDLSTPECVDYLEYASFNTSGLSVIGKVNGTNLKQDFSSVKGLIKWCSASSYNEEKGTCDKQYLVAGDSSVIGFVDKHPELGHVTVNINPVKAIDHIKIEEGTSPSTTVYLEGSTFSSSGLKVLGFDAEEALTPVSINSYVKWYDGVSAEAEDKEQWSTALVLGTTSVVGLFRELSVTVSGITVIGFDHFTVTDGIPDTVNYITGSEFKSGGLEIMAYGTDPSMDPVKITGSKFTWYDGPSYEKEGDEQVKTKKLAEGTTYVVGEYNSNRALTVKIEGISVRSYSQITVQGTPVAHQYLVGESFDATGLVVNVSTGGENPIVTNITTDKDLKWYTNDTIDSDKPSTVVTESTTAFIASYKGLRSEPQAISVGNLVKIEVDATNLAKAKYAETSQFDPTGLIIKGYFGSEESTPVDITGKIDMVWYDGQSYAANTEDLSKAVKTLQVGSDKVVGVAKNYNFVVEVTVNVVPFTRIDASESTLEKVNYAEGDSFLKGTNKTFIYGYTDDPEIEKVKIANGDCKFYDPQAIEQSLSYKDKLREGSEHVVVQFTSGSGSVLSTTIEGIHVYKIFAIEARGTAEVIDYATGSKFNPQGLSVVALYGEKGTENVFEKDITTNVTWVDHASGEELLPEGATQVHAKYEDFNKTIFETEPVTINAVKTEKAQMSLVKSIDVLKEGGDFILASNANDVYLNSTASDLKKTDALASFDFTDSETYEVSKALCTQTLHVDFDGTYFHIKNGAGQFLGLTSSGNTSWAKTPTGSKNLEITMDENGNLTVKCLEKYYGFTTGPVLSFLAEEVSNLQFYKIAD